MYTVHNKAGNNAKTKLVIIKFWLRIKSIRKIINKSLNANKNWAPFLPLKLQFNFKLAYLNEDKKAEKNVSQSAFVGYKLSLANDFILTLSKLLLEGTDAIYYAEDDLSMHQPPISAGEFSKQVDYMPFSKLDDARSRSKINFLVTVCRHLIKAIVGFCQTSSCNADQMEYFAGIRRQIKGDFIKAISNIRVFENELLKKGLNEVSRWLNQLLNTLGLV